MTPATPPRSREPCREPLEALVLDEVAARRGGRLLVPPFSGRFPVGSFLWITGPNGAGKSTLLLTLAGLGRPVRAVRPEGTGRHPVRYELQDGEGTWKAMHRRPGLLTPDMSLPSTYRVGAWRRFLRTGGGDVQSLLPGRGPPDGRRAGQLSAGEGRTLLLEGLLAARREVYLLDEPFEHLHEETVAVVLAALRRRAEQGVVVAVSHRLPMLPSGGSPATHRLIVPGGGMAARMPVPTQPMFHPPDRAAPAGIRYRAAQVAPRFSSLAYLRLELGGWIRSAAHVRSSVLVAGILVAGEWLWRAGRLVETGGDRWLGFAILAGLPVFLRFDLQRDRDCGFLSFALFNHLPPLRLLSMKVLGGTIRLVQLLGLCLALSWLIRATGRWDSLGLILSWGALLVSLLPAVLFLEVVGRVRFPALGLGLLYAGTAMGLAALGRSTDVLHGAIGVLGGLPPWPDRGLTSRAVGGLVVTLALIPPLAMGLRCPGIPVATGSNVGSQTPEVPG